MRGSSPIFPARRSPGALLRTTSAGQGAAPAPARERVIAPMAVPLMRGLYRNNGASPWYASVLLGSPGQPLRMAVDTGAAFIWVTSSLCAPDSCRHSSGGRFVYQNSSSFHWVEQDPKSVSFGPWGSMTVESGQDQAAIGPNAPVTLDMYLSSEYSGEEFAELDWDGGIGIPSGSDYADPGTSFSVAELMNAGRMDPARPYVSFCTDAATSQGTVLFGGIDFDAIDPNSGIYMPWTPYTAFPNVKYIWTTPLAAYSVGSYSIANVQFSLDSGSSQFKGDPAIMQATLAQIAQSPGVDVILRAGTTADGTPGEIVVPPEVYNVTIQGGPDRGKTLPQFNPLDLPGLVLVGSVLMDQLYTVYVYHVVDTGQGYHLSPVGMAAFNKKGGPALIRSQSGRCIPLGERPVHKG